VGEGVAAVTALVTAKLTQFTVNQGDIVTIKWAAMLPQLITTYHDGFVADVTGPVIKLQHMFYPRWWLEVSIYIKIYISYIIYYIIYIIYYILFIIYYIVYSIYYILYTIYIIYIYILYYIYLYELSAST
jgi:hypothetical protein